MSSQETDTKDAVVAAHSQTVVHSITVKLDTAVSSVNKLSVQAQFSHTFALALTTCTSTISLSRSRPPSSGSTALSDTLSDTLSDAAAAAALGSSGSVSAGLLFATAAATAAAAVGCCTFDTGAALPVCSAAAPATTTAHV
jgi:hypothetical protein